MTEREETIARALRSGAREMGLTLTPEQIGTFCAFGGMLLEKNQVMNLTAVTEPDAAARLHFLDSLALLPAADFSRKSVIDVGCGAGFPGVPLKIAQPSLRLTLLDSLRKRISWLQEVLPELGIEAECVCARAEDFAAPHREQFDLAVSRAVARLDVLSELCLPLVRPGGRFLAMKAGDCAEEIRGAEAGIRLLGGEIERVRAYAVPETGRVRTVVCIRKLHPTPAEYPRRFAKIKSHPLGGDPDGGRET